MRERTLWLVGLAGLLGSSGCIVGDDGGNSQFYVQWSLAYVGGGAVSCDLADTPTVELTMTNTGTNQMFVDSFPCSAAGGQSRNLPPGHYEVAIALKDRAGEVVSTNEGPFDLVRHSPTALPPISFVIQSFELSWSLAHGRDSIACADAGAKFVNLVTRLNSAPQVTYSFPCEAGAGATPAILLGTYSVGITVVDANNNVLWQSDPMTIPVDDSQRAILPPATIPL
jgi:hypothetical protein